MTLPANRRSSDDYSLGPSPQQRTQQDHTKRADSGTVELDPSVDHDDLLALLKRPRPQHGDLRALLRRTFARAASRKMGDPAAV
jgi:hypothetical protein